MIKVVSNQEQTATGPLPIIFKSKGTPLTDYKLYGTSEGAGVETENLCDVSFFTNNYSLDTKTGFPVPTQQDRICTISPINVNDLNAVTLSWSAKAGIDVRAIYSIFNNGTLIARVANAYNNVTIDVSSANEMYICLYTLTLSDINYIMLVPGSTAPASYIPYGYKLPMMVGSRVYNLVDIESISLLSNDRYGIVIDAPGAYTITAFANSSTYIYCRSYDANNDPISNNLPVVSSSGTIKTRTLTINQGEKIYVFDPITTSTLTSAKAKFTNDYIVAVSGYTAPDHYIPHRYEQNYNLYLGDSQLGEEEYVDYGEQKVYKRTENLFDKNKVEAFEHTQMSQSNLWIRYDGVAIVYRYPCEPNTTYSVSVFAESTIFRISMIATDDIPGQSYGASVVINDIVKQANTQPVTFTTSSNAKYLLMQIAAYIQDDLPNILAIVKGSTPPETYIPYLQPTDPPVPLPELSTYQGENTLSCSEGLGDESQITFVGPVEETITKIMRTEDDGQGNVTEHVLYKEGS